MTYNKFDFDTLGPDMKSNDMLVPTLIEPTIFRDERGYFFESFNLKDFNEKMGTNIKFVQDNESLSKKGVVRGLHFQKPLCEQAKLVRVVKGAVYDVAVDIRRWSKTFGKYVGVYLSEDNHQQFFIPEGFAHGFIVLSEEAELLYKTSKEYNKDADCGIYWADETLAIDLGINFEPILSEKDKNLPKLEEIIL
jgi:dTDP-4-dehydrorhamnose 3,5-epimerase